MDESPFDEQMSRIQLVTGVHTQAELAGFLGTRQSIISDAKRRKIIPASWLVILMRCKNVHPEWILTGKGPCYVPISAEGYETGPQAVERQADEEALRRLPSRVLADELVRRIAVTQNTTHCIGSNMAR